MKVVVIFGGVKVVVPCGGEMKVSQVMQEALLRLKKILNQQASIQVHHLKTRDSGALLDAWDNISDVADDKEQLIAMYTTTPNIEQLLRKDEECASSFVTGEALRAGDGMSNGTPSPELSPMFQMEAYHPHISPLRLSQFSSHQRTSSLPYPQDISDHTTFYGNNLHSNSKLSLAPSNFFQKGSQSPYLNHFLNSGNYESFNSNNSDITNFQQNYSHLKANDFFQQHQKQLHRQQQKYQQKQQQQQHIFRDNQLYNSQRSNNKNYPKTHVIYNNPHINNNHIDEIHSHKKINTNSNKIINSSNYNNIKNSTNHLNNGQHFIPCQQNFFQQTQHNKDFKAHNNLYSINKKIISNNNNLNKNNHNNTNNNLSNNLHTNIKNNINNNLHENLIKSNGTSPNMHTSKGGAFNQTKQMERQHIDLNFPILPPSNFRGSFNKTPINTPHRITPNLCDSNKHGVSNLESNRNGALINYTNKGAAPILRDSNNPDHTNGPNLRDSNNLDFTNAPNLRGSNKELKGIIKNLDTYKKDEFLNTKLLNCSGDDDEDEKRNESISCDDGLVGRDEDDLIDRFYDRFIVTLVKEPTGLGFSVTSQDNKQQNIFVKNILARGSAIKEGSLRPGDCIFKVNGVRLKGKKQEEVVRMLRCVRVDEIVKMEVGRKKETSHRTLYCQDNLEKKKEEEEEGDDDLSTLNASSVEEHHDSLEVVRFTRDALSRQSMSEKRKAFLNPKTSASFNKLKSSASTTSLDRMNSWDRPARPTQPASNKASHHHSHHDLSTALLNATQCQDLQQFRARNINDSFRAAVEKCLEDNNNNNNINNKNSITNIDKSIKGDNNKTNKNEKTDDTRKHKYDVKKVKKLKEKSTQLNDSKHHHRHFNQTNNKPLTKENLEKGHKADKFEGFKEGRKIESASPNKKDRVRLNLSSFLKFGKKKQFHM